MYLLDIRGLNNYFDSRGWSNAQVAARQKIHYTHVYRILHGDRNPGGKFILSFLTFCMEEGLDIEVFLMDNSGTKRNQQKT